MSLTVYNGEHFERSKRRYVGFSFVIILIIGLSLWKKNIVGVILLFFILGAYIYYTLIATQTTKLHIKEKFLTVGEKNIPRQELSGYIIEGDKKTQTPKNLIFIGQKGHIIFTLNDSEKAFDTFMEELDNYLPITSEYKQSTLDKRGKILQL